MEQTERPAIPGRTPRAGAFDVVEEALEQLQPTVDVAADPAQQRQLAEGGADPVVVAERLGDVGRLIGELLGRRRSPVYRALFDWKTSTVEAMPRSPRRINRIDGRPQDLRLGSWRSRKCRISPCSARAPSSAELVAGSLAQRTASSHSCHPASKSL